MDGKTKAGIISVVLAVIGLGAGGAAYTFDFDFSNNSSQSNTDNSVSSGDTITNYITEQAVDNEVIYGIGEEIALDLICEGDVVPDGFVSQCAEYWCWGETNYDECVEEETQWILAQ